MFSQVVLAGGSCRIPRLRDLLAKEFPNSELLSSIPVEHVVTLGAAMQAALLVEYSDKLPSPLPSSLPCVSNDIHITVSTEGGLLFIIDSIVSVLAVSTL